MKLAELFESAAERHLKRRGRFVLPRKFVGFAIGGWGTAINRETHFELSWPIPTNSVNIIAVNHSYVAAIPSPPTPCI